MANKFGSEFSYVPFSEERVVQRLIKERSTCDATFYPTIEPGNMLTSDGVYSLDEDVICVYADLDNLIERAELSGAERKTVDLVMKGYSLADIADHYGKTRQSFEILMKRAVKKIVRRNNQDWDACYWDN